MSRNLWLVLGTAILFGISTGIYEFVLPNYLRAQGIGFEKLGIIFALAALAMVAARIYMGGLADRLGRKHLYGAALAVCGLASGAATWCPGLVGQLLLKMVRETAALTRETLHPVIIYEAQRAAFLNFIGKFRGVEFLLQAGGTLLAGALIARMAEHDAYRLALHLAGGLLLGGAVLWSLRFVEQWKPTASRPISLRELCNLNVHPNLRWLMVSGIIFTFGVQLSHSFYLPLFFGDRFEEATPWAVSVIMVLHRVTIGLPLLVVGELRLRNLRAWYVIGMLIEGITMAGCALIPHFLLSAGIFLLHDLLGAGIWSPIQATIIQRYSRDETRAVDVGKVLAWSSLGSIAGPLVAGVLAAKAPYLPFLISGIVMALSALPLLKLDLHAPALAAVPVAAE